MKTIIQFLEINNIVCITSPNILMFLSCLKIGSSDIDPMAIQFCARKVHAITGDVRKALDILRYF